MTVFNLSLRLIKRDIPTMALFIGLFLAISVIVTLSGSDTQIQSFQQTRVPMAFIPQETNPIVDGLRAELNSIAEIVPLSADLDSQLDGLFFGDVSYVLTVPLGFTQSFLDRIQASPLGSQTPDSLAAQVLKPAVPLEKILGSNETRGVYLDMVINRYLNTLAIYRATMPQEPLVETVRAVREDLRSRSRVTMSPGLVADGSQTTVDRPNPAPAAAEQAQVYFNFQAYSLLAILILGISTNLLVFNNRNIRMRLASSPQPARRINLSLAAANFLFALVCWSIMGIASVIFIPNILQSGRIIPFLINSLVLTFWAASLSFLIAHLAKSRNGINSITNVVALGTSFIAGVFVPHELLGEGVLQVARFTPTFWFVRANGLFAGLPGSQGLSAVLTNPEVIQSVGLQIGFGLAFLAVALVLGKGKQTRAA